jgi:hypothetical protein
LRCSRLTTPLQARKHLKMGTVAPVNSWWKNRKWRFSSEKMVV